MVNHFQLRKIYSLTHVELLTASNWVSRISMPVHEWKFYFWGFHCVPPWKSTSSVKSKDSSARTQIINCYILATLPLTLSEMTSGQSVPTDYEGNPPLWITKNHRNEIYVNNARIIISKSNVQASNQNKKNQVIKFE